MPYAIQSKKVLTLTAICLAGMLLLTGCPADQVNEQQVTADKERLDFETAISSGRFARSGKPVPSGIMWLPDGASFLYRIREGEGEASTTMMYRYDAATGEITEVADWGAVEKRLEQLTEDRPEAALNDVNTSARVSYTQMDLSSDGQMLVGSYNNDLYVYSLNSGDVRFLTDDAEVEIWPSFSPDGSKIAFAKDRDLYVLNLTDNSQRRLTRRENDLIYNGVPDWVYDEEFALRRAFWWSPNSDSLAFIQFDTRPIKTFPIVDNLSRIAVTEEQQYPKAGDANSIVRAGVVDLQGAITWIDTGREEDSYIARVGWVPSGNRVWLQWVNRDQTAIDLLFANPGSGEVNLVLKEEDEAWVEVRDDLLFVDDTRFIWSSERSGWRHLYLYGIDGVLERPVTSGEWSVEQVAGLDSESNSIFFTSTAESPLERHIYRIGIDGEDLVKLSEGEGWHTIDKADRGSFYIASYENITTPRQASIHSADGSMLREFYKTTSPMAEKYGMAVPEFFTITADDGAELWASLIKPTDFDPGKKYPVLVSIYGGPNSQAVTKRFRYSPQQQYLVQEGILIFRIDNRGTSARGRDWLRSMHRRLGYWELKDHVTGVEYLKSLPYVDGEKIAIMGGSYGGYMTLYAMLKAPEHFPFGISMYPVTDWRFYDTIYTERYMDRPQDNEEGYAESAPLNYAENLQGELLLIHGAMDNNVHLANTTAMVEALVKAGKQFQLMIYPRERHGIRAPHRSRHNQILINTFLMENLLGRTPEFSPEAGD